MKRFVYMDNQATTRVDPRVLEAMLPYFSERYGNAASRSHPYGWEAEEAVERARHAVANVINARTKEIVFTSGATESDNLALKGVLEFNRNGGDHIITAATEHKAVLDTCRALERTGRASVTYLPVDRYGGVDPDDVRRAITDGTVLISIMHANNEIGTIQPLREIAAVARENEILFHTDAAQSFGKVPIDVEVMGIDLLSMSAHKLYGPKGCGALYVRSRQPRVRLEPMIHGGGHERGMRSGTLNVAGVVGFGRACEIAMAEMDEEGERVSRLRDRLHNGIVTALDDVHLNGDPTRRLAGNLNLAFAHVEGESLLMGIQDEIAVSTGSACTSATLESSHVLKAIGVGDELSHSSIRFSLGRFNDEDDVAFVIERVASEVRRQRSLSPRYEIARRASVDRRSPKEGSDGCEKSR
jgi:cysteine desulfurase